MSNGELDARTARKISSMRCLGEIDGYRKGAEFRGDLGAVEKAAVMRREKEIRDALKRKKGKVSR